VSVERADLELYQGDDYFVTATVVGEDCEPLDLTGYTARAQIRRKSADAEPEVAAEMTAVVEGSSVLLTLDHTETATLKDRYVWDLELTAPDGVVVTILAGYVKVIPEVTRAAIAGAS